MPGTETTYEHIVLDDRDVPIIEGTTMKVIELAGAALANSWSPAELQNQFPFLTLGQIHSALAYYWDHQAALDQDMERRLQHVEELRRHAGPSQLRARLKEHDVVGVELPTRDELESEQKWDNAFAKSKGALAKLAAKARTNFEAGLTEPLDPDRL